jgi:hypothetical protein
MTPWTCDQDRIFMLLIMIEPLGTETARYPEPNSADKNNIEIEVLGPRKNEGHIKTSSMHNMTLGLFA